MAPRLRLLVLGGAFLGILHTSVAGADPVTVTSGRFDVVWDDPSGFAFFGPGFELSAGFARVSSVAQQTCFAGCTPGTKVNLSATAGGASPFSLGTSMSAVINGVVAVAIPVGA